MVSVVRNGAPCWPSVKLEELRPDLVGSQWDLGILRVIQVEVGIWFPTLDLVSVWIVHSRLSIGVFSFTDKLNHRIQSQNPFKSCTRRLLLCLEIPDELSGQSRLPSVPSLDEANADLTGRPMLSLYGPDVRGYLNQIFVCKIPWISAGVSPWTFTTLNDVLEVDALARVGRKDLMCPGVLEPLVVGGGLQEVHLVHLGLGDNVNYTILVVPVDGYGGHGSPDTNRTL